MTSAQPRWVSDAVVDLLVDAGIDHIAFNPGATFRGVHDSLVNHRPDGPRIVLCPHEGISVSIAHGYAKAAGRPMAAMLHNVVGLQHASMAIYNAWVDRVPMLLLGGTGPMSTAARRPWIDWIHTANVQGQVVRDYVKWDDQPVDAASIPRALARALNITRAQPPGPVYICLDAGVQEEELVAGDPPWPSPARFAVPTAPGATAEQLDVLAERLRQARLPVIITDYAGDTAAGHDALATLADLLQAPVIDRGARHNFTVGHALNFTELPDILREADLVVGFEVEDLFGVLAGHDIAGHQTVHVTTAHLRARSWAHDVGELTEADTVLSAAVDGALAALVARLRERPPAPAIVEARRTQLGDRATRRHTALWEQARRATSDGAVHPARLAAEAWEVLGRHDPVLVHSKTPDWERRLWPLRGHGAHLGWHGGGGLGHGLGASIGAALALAGGGRLLVDLQPDGDLLFTPSALWTAAHLSVPLLVIVQNNRQYRNTVEHAARIAAHRGRSAENRYVGAGLQDPAVDYATLARAFGVWATGPVTEPEALAPALAAAVAEVDAGRPALVEVVTEGA